MTCPYLEYRSSDDDHEFDAERPYCTAKVAFVSPMLADVCNDRDRFDHTEDCDIYRASAAAEDASADD